MSIDRERLRSLVAENRAVLDRLAEGPACPCDEPCDLCVERDGVCQRGEDCKCKNGEIALPGW